MASTMPFVPLSTTPDGTMYIVQTVILFIMSMSWYVHTVSQVSHPTTTYHLSVTLHTHTPPMLDAIKAHNASTRTDSDTFSSSGQFHHSIIGPYPTNPTTQPIKRNVMLIYKLDGKGSGKINSTMTYVADFHKPVK
ncbi:Hypothetical predicted protein [Pelobates cultripes]|uniref:Uncharacterized protein n=1 Tax=Pelobates cultripes TaxID=61616 RepID=A0AAD1TQK7_PELCU|nr:Hypothetical predicted protein [Pelobates cultripes]